MANRFSTAIAILLLLTMSLTAAPQTPGGSIRGTVYDKKGVIPDASVTVTNQETNVTHEVKSDKIGQYSVSDLPPGIYTVTGALEGFISVKHTGTIVRDSITVALDLHLKSRIWGCT